MTLIETVQAQSARLAQAGVSFGHGTTNAFDEAAWLVQWALGLPLDALDAEAERPVSANERMAVEALIERRIRSRVPSTPGCRAARSARSTCAPATAAWPCWPR